MDVSLRFVLVIFVVRRLPGFTECMCSSVYGAKPCPYLPSPPGESPPCAKPGVTFCEYPSHYPRDQIKYLLGSMRVDPTVLLADESKQDYYFPGTKFIPSTYGPPQNNIHYSEKFYPDTTYGGPVPPTGYPTNPYLRNNSYSPFITTYNLLNNFNKQTSKIPSGYDSYYRYNAPTFQNNGWGKWNRNDKFYESRRKRSIDKIRRWYYSSNYTKSLERSKRQAAGSPQGLCPTRASYIMPRAALNNKGDWMYVVNVPEVDNRFTQLVKSEICAGTSCSALCGLPDGYTSKCEQKYVQKRLIAMESGGSQLYNDVFWFPSCCLCTITPTGN